LLRRSGGFVARIRDTGRHAGGEAALAAACRDGFLGEVFAGAALGDRAVDLDDVRRSFRERFPEGIVYAPEGPVPAALAKLPTSDKRAILRDAAAFGHGFRAADRGSRLDVTAFCDEGEVKLVFVAEADARAARDWHALIRRCNAAAALGGEVSG
jgi:hypothetical protein